MMQKLSWWEDITFDEVCSNVSSRIYEPSNSGYDKYVGLEHLDTLEPKIMRYGNTRDVKSSMTLFKEGQILFGRRNWYLRRVAVADFDGICSADIYVLEAKADKIMPDFLPIFMHSKQFFDETMKYSAGSMSTRVKWSNLSKIKFSIPSIRQQEKIVALVFGIDDSIAKTQSLLEKLKTYKSSKMNELLTKGINHKKFKKIKWYYGKEIEIPEEWQVNKIKEVTLKFGSGGTPSTSNKTFWDGNIPWTKSAALTEQYIHKGERFITTKGLKNSSSIIIPKNNLLVASRVSMGNLSINTIDMAISQDITGVIVDKSKILVQYLYWYLIQHIYKLVSFSQGTTVQGFLQKDFADFLVTVPTIFEQQEIIVTLSNINEQITKLADHLSKLKMMRTSIINENLMPPRQENRIVQ